MKLIIFLRYDKYVTKVVMISYKKKKNNNNNVTA